MPNGWGDLGRQRTSLQWPGKAEGFSSVNITVFSLLCVASMLFHTILCSSAFGLQSLVSLHPPSFFFLCVIILPFLYFRFPPMSLVPFMFQSLKYPWGRGHPLQGGFCGNMKGAWRWAFCVSFIFFITPPPLTWPPGQAARRSRSSCFLLQTPEWFSLMFPYSLNPANTDKKCRCLKISQRAENIWSIAFYLLVDGNSIFLQSVLMEHPRLKAQNMALYSSISLCSLTNRVNSFYIRLCG